MTVHLFATHPRLSEPVSPNRGWLILCAAVVSWLVFILGAYGLFAALTWVAGLLP